MSSKSIISYEHLKEELSKQDAKFRMIARGMCRSSSIGDDLYHNSVLKVLELSLLGIEIRDLKKILYSIMTTTRLDMLRNFNNSKTQSLEAETLDAIVNSNAESTEETRDLLRRALSFISRIENDVDREIFLSYINGVKIRSISSVYNISANTVKSKIRRTRIALKKYLNHG